MFILKFLWTHSRDWPKDTQDAGRE